MAVGPSYPIYRATPTRRDCLSMLCMSRVILQLMRAATNKASISCSVHKTTLASGVWRVAPTDSSLTSRVVFRSKKINGYHPPLPAGQRHHSCLRLRNNEMRGFKPYATLSCNVVRANTITAADSWLGCSFPRFRSRISRRLRRRDFPKSERAMQPPSRRN